MIHPINKHIDIMNPVSIVHPAASATTLGEREGMVQGISSSTATTVLVEGI